MKIEKESLLKQLFTNIQHSAFAKSINFKILHILNEGEVCVLNGGKLIILSTLSWRIDTLSLG